MSRTSKYYLPRAIANAERKLEELRLQQEIEIIDRQLELLASFKSLYSAHRAGDEQPCTLHTAALPS